MEIKFFSSLRDSDKAGAIEKLIKGSSPSQHFFLMVILAVLMATFGIIQESPAVIIGSMLIAPVLYPVLGLSMGFVMSNSELVSRSFMTLAKSFLYSTVASFIAAVLFSSILFDISLSTYFIKPSLLSATVAIIAGLAVSFTIVKSGVNETLPGVAISVSLVPPMAALGIGLSLGNFPIVISAFLLFLINVLGIIFSSMFVFSLMNFYVKRKVATTEIKKDEKVIEKEKIVESE